MKAINFIEYYKNQLDLLNADKEKGWHFVNNTERAYNFFSQEFKPELVEEYFENQSVITDDNGLDKGFAFPNNENYYFWSGGVASLHEFCLPKTLDNFITD